jgi:hypothetical protein
MLDILTAMAMVIARWYLLDTLRLTLAMLPIPKQTALQALVGLRLPAVLATSRKLQEAVTA